MPDVLELDRVIDVEGASESADGEPALRAECAHCQLLEERVCTRLLRSPIRHDSGLAGAFRLEGLEEVF